MIYLIFGSNKIKREIAREKIWKKIGENFLIARKIDKTNIEEIKNYINESSLFGEKLIVEMSDLLTLESSRKYIYDSLEEIVNSKNIFILDEPFALKASFTKIVKDGKLKEGENAFDASEESIKKDLEPGKFCDLIENRNKKGAWVEWKKIHLEWGIEEEMFLHAALWYRWKMIWEAKLQNKNSRYDYFTKSNTQIKYSLEELEKFGKEISLMAMKKTNGEIDLMREIERFVLKI